MMINSFHPNCHFLQVRWLRENWHLIPAGKTLAPVAASFYELMTAPTTKVMMMMVMMRMMTMMTMMVMMMMMVRLRSSTS